MKYYILIITVLLITAGEHNVNEGTKQGGARFKIGETTYRVKADIRTASLVSTPVCDSDLINEVNALGKKYGLDLLSSADTVAVGKTNFSAKTADYLYRVQVWSNGDNSKIVVTIVNRFREN